MAADDFPTFVAGVSQATGIDPRVLVAWVRSEGHPGDLYNNWLNIAAPTAQYLHEPTSGTAAGNTAEFPDVQTGVDATVKEIRNLGLTHLANETPRQEISQIAASPWASSHYGGPGGPNLVNTFSSIFKGAIDAPYQGPAGAGGVAAEAGTGSAAIPGGIAGDLGPFNPGGVSGIVSGIRGGGRVTSGSGAILPQAPAFKNLFDFLTSWRFAEVVGGALLLIIGLLLLGRQFGLQTPILSPPRAATRAQDQAAETFQFQPGERDYANAQRTSREGTGRRRTTSYTLEADRPAPAPARSELEDVGIPF